MENSSHSGRFTRAMRRLVAASAGIAGAFVFITSGAASAQPQTETGETDRPAEQTAAGIYDYNGDGLDDIVARRSETGNLEIWPGNGSGGFNPRYTVGAGWNSMDLIETAGDLNEDGRADLLARHAATNTLYFYPGNGTTFGSRVSIGLGWHVMSSIISGHDYTGDGYVDIIATEAGTGTLWLYPGTGTGTTFGRRFQIGSDYQQWREMTAVGDMDEDGHADMVAVKNSDDAMYFFAGPGSQKFKAPVKFDAGWDVMDSAAAVGDFDGDGHMDWVGRWPEGGWLWLFEGDGTGGSDGSFPIDTAGWNSMTIA